MNYAKLADEYSEEAKSLKGYINKIKKDYGKPISIEDGQMYYRVKILYNMYLDLNHVGKYLRKKYEVMLDDK